MDFSVRVTMRPQPGIFPRGAVVVIFVFLVVGVAIRAGYGPPDVTMFALGAGLAGAQVARAAFPARTGRRELR